MKFASGSDIAGNFPYQLHKSALPQCCGRSEYNSVFLCCVFPPLHHRNKPHQGDTVNVLNLYLDHLDATEQGRRPRGPETITGNV